MDAMRKLLLGTTLTRAIAFVSPASAMPAGYPLLRDAAVSIDLIEVGGAKVGGTSTVIARLVGAAPARWAGAAMAARPVTGRRAGATHPLRRSISRMDQGIGLERDDFLRIVITFGTNALYGRSVDFVNTWGSAAVWVS